MNQQKVYVLLSTYNGEKYLTRQLDSILGQKNVDVKLMIRDDGSTDQTITILKAYESKYSNVTVFEGNNIGYIQSFMWLVRNCESNSDAFYAFSDQDDVWDEMKLSAAVTMLKMEDMSQPLLYYSDLNVVDSEEHFIRRANDWEGNIDKYMLSVFIGIRGCTMVFNGALHQLLVPYEINDISGHDTYIALIAFWLGKVIYDSKAYINYRQTGDNLSITGTSKLDKLRKNLLYVKKRLTTRKCIHEKNAKEVIAHYEKTYRNELQELHFVADYRESIGNHIRLMVNHKFKQFSIPIRIFNDIFIVLNKL